MPPTYLSDEQQQRRKRAQNWKLFRKNNFLSQRKLAEIVGISRRTVQLVEGEYITPKPQTLHRFATFKRKYDVNEDLRMNI